jgi:leucyl/phenylalanyl-tRNA--protein transferase
MKSVFPNVDEANEYGIIALGGDPNPALLLDAYTHGIFPWPHPDLNELPWFAPEERAILYFKDFRSKSRIKRYIKSESFEFSFNTHFKQVITACASPINRAVKSTWINDEMIEGYDKLNKLGFAHSVEVFKNDLLVGGLYGVSIGRMFAAESMYFRVSNASKAALYALSYYLNERGCHWIDCQQLTSHLSSLGGIEIPRKEFMKLLNEALQFKNIKFPSGNFKLI